MKAPCFICKKSCSSNKELFQHLNFMHGPQKIYKCGENDCVRSYNLMSSFRKHRKQVHSSEEDGSSFVDSLSTSDVEINLLVDSNQPNYDAIIDINSSLSSPDLESVDDDNNQDCVGSLNSSEFLTLFKFKDLLRRDSIKCLSYLYALSDLPRKRVRELVDVFTSMILDGEAFNALETHVISNFENLSEGIEHENEILKLREFFSVYREPFSEVDSEHLAFKWFKNSNCFVLPETVEIGSRTEFKKINRMSNNKVESVEPINRAVLVKSTVQFVPMRLMLKQFFELPDVFDNTMSFLRMLEKEMEDGVVRNIIQAEFWQNLKYPPFSTENSFVTFPLIVYFDDYEPNNPLGSHAGFSKCGAVYLSIPCLPIYMQSKLENIFLFLLFNTLDRNKIDLKIIFSRVISELNFLENEGISISLANGLEKKILFKLVVVTGDNLGLQTLFGFFESFSANFFCRFCFVPKSLINTIFTEDNCELRDASNYDKHGVKRPCVFHEVGDFHVTKNVVVDNMHDWLEGIVRYDLSKILNYFIYEKRFFTITLLNERLQGFKYGKHEKRSAPPNIISFKNDKNEPTLNKMSASEMLCFLRIITLLLGRYVPVDNPHWKLLIALRNLVEIVFSRSIHKDTWIYFKILYKEYLEQLQELFPHYSVKPKHHIGVHYPSVMRKMGPLCNINSMRFESKHRPSKITASISLSRVNVQKTLAIKHQLSMCNRFLKKQGNNGNDFKYGPISQVTDELIIKQVKEHLSEMDDVDNIKRVKWVDYHGTEIEEGTVIVEPKESTIKFYKVGVIIIPQKGAFLIFATKLKTEYDNHFDCYKICERTDNVKIFLLDDELLFSCILTSETNNYIIKKWMM